MSSLDKCLNRHCNIAMYKFIPFYLNHSHPESPWIIQFFLFWLTTPSGTSDYALFVKHAFTAASVTSHEPALLV